MQCLYHLTVVLNGHCSRRGLPYITRFHSHICRFCFHFTETTRALSVNAKHSSVN